VAGRQRSGLAKIKPALQQLKAFLQNGRKKDLAGIANRLATDD
jgi:hypothetical protein